jgi:hypothetical protein
MNKLDVRITAELAKTGRGFDSTVKLNSKLAEQCLARNHHGYLLVLVSADPRPASRGRNAEKPANAPLAGCAGCAAGLNTVLRLQENEKSSQGAHYSHDSDRRQQYENRDKAFRKDDCTLFRQDGG